MEGTRARRVVPTRAMKRRAWGGAVGPCGRSKAQRSCSGAFSRDEPAPQGGPLELDAVSAMENAIKDRVAKGGIADHLMPAIYGNLAGDQQRAAIVAVVDDLEQIATLLGIERLRPPIIDDQQPDAFERRQQPRQPAFAARLGEIVKQPGGAFVEHREAFAAGLMAKGASQPRLADSGWPDDHQMVMIANPLATGERLEESAVEAARGAEVDILDHGGLAQSGFAQTAREALVLAAGRLAVDQVGQANPRGSARRYREHSAIRPGHRPWPRAID